MDGGEVELNGKVYRIYCGVPAPNSDYRIFEDVIDERQRKEIEFAGIYEEDFHHGTTGHNQLMLISMMARLIRVIPIMLAEVKK